MLLELGLEVLALLRDLLALLDHVGLRLGNACLAAVRRSLDARLALCLLQATLTRQLVVVRQLTGQLLGLTGDLAEHPARGRFV